jgi:hypothetical protein
VSVMVGGVLITLVDPEEFPDLGTGLWWALQTVTTVGYGDVTPENTAGRLVGALFLLEAISFVTIVTAVITSSFVERARQERDRRHRHLGGGWCRATDGPALGHHLETGADPTNPRLRRIGGSHAQMNVRPFGWRLCPSLGPATVGGFRQCPASRFFRTAMVTAHTSTNSA